MSVRLLEYDDVAGTYSLADPETYHDAWYIRGRVITEADPVDGDTLVWDEDEEEFTFAPGGSGVVYNGYFPMGW